MKLHNKNMWLIACYTLFIIYAILVIKTALFNEITAGEIDSNALPVISLQYRLSTTCNKNDLFKAQKDFPDLYTGINDFNDLRCSKLVYADDNHWLPYYFPIYPLVCIPVKIVLQIMGMTQERTFPITNAILILISLFYLIKCLKTEDKTKFFSLLLLIISPINFYITYINYECFICSLAIISVITYYCGHRRISALILSIAGMSNQTVMGMGMIMILFWIISIVKNNIITYKSLKIISLIKENILYSISYAMCFVPCLIPSIWRILFVGNDPFKGMLDKTFYYDRVLAYFFDINIGVSSFAPIVLLLSIILAAVIIIKKQFNKLFLFLSFMSIVLCFSLMAHICCGMIYCARYITWSYPILALFVGLCLPEYIQKSWKQILIFSLSAISSFVIIGINVNRGNKLDCHYFNYTSQWILDNIPQLYNPIHCIYYTRVNHIDNQSNYDFENYGVTYYTDSSTAYSSNGKNVRKILFRANAEQEKQILNEVKGDSNSIQYLKRLFDKYQLDGKLHYINIEKNSKYQVYKKSIEDNNRLVPETIAEASDCILSPAGDNAIIFALPVSVESNTWYKIEIEINDKQKDYKDLWIDFYGDGYDYPEQETHSFVNASVREYAIFWNSGDVGSNNDVTLRCIMPNKNNNKNLKIDSIRVSALR